MEWVLECEFEKFLLLLFTTLQLSTTFIFVNFPFRFHLKSLKPKEQIQKTELLSKARV